MIRKFIILCAALVLAACASLGQAPSTLEPAKAHATTDVVATLATNACEAAVAADYTGVIVARRQAASLLRGKKISVATAEAVQKMADQARAQLDAACPGGKPDELTIKSARALREQITKTLESGHAN